MKTSVNSVLWNISSKQILTYW